MRVRNEVYFSVIVQFAIISAQPKFPANKEEVESYEFTSFILKLLLWLL